MRRWSRYLSSSRIWRFFCPVRSGAGRRITSAAARQSLSRPWWRFRLRQISSPAITRRSSCFCLQGTFGAGGIHVQYPAYLAERFPTEVRATAGGFVYHQGAIFGGLVGPVLAYLATSWNIGFAIPMLIGTTVGCVSLILAILFSPETKGRVLSAELSVA